MRNAFVLAVLLTLLTAGASAQCVSIDAWKSLPQPKTQVTSLPRQLTTILAGTVNGESGAVIRGAKVMEMSSDWQSIARMTTSDDRGRWSFSPVSGRKLYHVQVSAEGFEKVRLLVKLDSRKGKELTIALPVAPTVQC